MTERQHDLAVLILAALIVAAGPAGFPAPVVWAAVALLVADCALAAGGLVAEIRHARRTRARYAAIARAYDL